MSVRQQIELALMLSLPAILAQTSSMLMQYIDAGMVGRLGANPSASIGLISTSTWILGGFTAGACSGFSVQVAHLCGAKDFKGARAVLRQGLTSVLILSFILSAIGVCLSAPLPRWLGGGPEIISDASKYFFIYSAFIPVGAVGWAASAMLQASGNMKIPSIMFTGMCVLDVIFNYIFIFVCGMGVAGAALGTGLSELVTSAFAVWYVLFKSKELNIKGEHGTFVPRRKTIDNAWSITAPMWLQNIIMRGAYVMSTIIVAPLGAIAIAANAFAITAESFCYGKHLLHAIVRDRGGFDDTYRPKPWCSQERHRKTFLQDNDEHGSHDTDFPCRADVHIRSPVDGAAERGSPGCRPWS